MPITSTAPHPVGTLQQLDPQTIAVDRNVRKHVHLDRGFKSSIKQRGVLQPPTAYWDDVAGAYQVLDGQRRVLAARDAKLETIPVVIIDAVAADEQRIVDQLAANEHRAALADVDKASAFGELALFGMSSDAIQRRTNLPEELITKGIRVSRSSTAAAVVEKHPDLAIEQAAAFAEFEDDEDALSQLQDQLRSDPSRLEHVAARIREDRKEAAARAAIEAELKAQGITVYADRLEAERAGGWPLGDTFATADHKEPLTVSDIEEMDGVSVGGIAYQTYDHEEGRWAWATMLFAIGAAAAGLHPRYSYMKSRGTAAATPEQAEAEKRARAIAKENTKAWRAASAVRLQFVKGVYQRKELPIGWTLFALRNLVDLTKQQYQSTWITASEILGSEISRSSYPAIEDLHKYIDDRPQNASQIMLGVALSVAEGENEFESKGWSWTGENRDRVTRYLELLQSWGYTLSEIEEHVVSGTVPA